MDIPDATAARLPAAGTPAPDLLAEIDRRRALEPDVHGARLFGLVYPTGRHDLEELLAEVNRRYLFGNALNPFKFPEVARFEGEVVAITGGLVHLPAGGGGSMTSGGTESILMSMLVNRERALARGVDAAADRGARVGAPGVQQGRALLRDGRRAHAARRRATAPTSARSATRSAPTPRSSWRRRSTTRTA